MKEIAIVFELDTNWIGGSYYIRNLVSALGMLPEEEQPNITLLCEKPETINFIQETGYHRLYWIKLTQFEERPDNFPFDAIFPHPIANQSARTISWIPDFQELHLPYYFSPEEITNRRHHHRLRFATAGLIVSSEDVKSDVDTFYPGECPNVAVVHFATFDRFDPEKLSRTKAKYGLPDRYTMCPNQVWVHKNHVVVLKALSLLKNENIDVTVCFTGNEQDYRIGGYASTLKAVAAEWKLGEQARFLGFIPRDDQLVLMHGADYIIQPSLFEGWSTVVEDAKAMGQFVVASDLAVHREQLTDRFRHFPRHNPQALAEIMAEFSVDPPARSSETDYDVARRRFGRDFMAACERFIPPTPTTRVIDKIELGRLSSANLKEANLEDTEPAGIETSDKPQAARRNANDVTLEYYEEGEYSQLSVVRRTLPGPETLLLQKYGDNYSIEFKIDTFIDWKDFSEVYLENDRGAVYRIFLGNDAGDMYQRYEGISIQARDLLVLTAIQSPQNIRVLNDTGDSAPQKLLEKCLVYIREFSEMAL